MRFLQLVATACFFAATSAWAGSQSTLPPASATTAKPLHRDDRQLVRSQAEVKRLEQDLDKQESDSKQASERLQQQDQTIAELRKQLQELHAGSATNSH